MQINFTIAKTAKNTSGSTKLQIVTFPQAKYTNVEEEEAQE